QHLYGGYPAPHNDDVFPPKFLGRSIFPGMELPALETFPTGISGTMGGLPTARGIDQAQSTELDPVGADDEPPISLGDLPHPDGAYDGKSKRLFVFLIINGNGHIGLQFSVPGVH